MHYGFSDPKDISSSGTYASDDDLAMTTMVPEGSGHPALYLVWKQKGGSQLMAAQSADGVTWSPPRETGQETDTFPAIALFQGELYVFWQKKGTNDILFGIMDPHPDELTVKMLGAVPIAASKMGVGAATYGDSLIVLHIGETTGIGGRSIYQASYDGKQWTSDAKVEKSQSSKDAPSLASFPGRLYQAHRGQTDGIAGNTVYYSFNDTGGSSDWSENKQAKGAEAQHRPGAGAFGDQVVIVHNGNTSHDLRLVYRPQEGGDWKGDDKIGSGYVSTYAPALAEAGGKLYMVFADRDHGDNLKVGSSTGL